ncbi:hypothetical protein LPJ66_009799, partial [Kickxella alabastrina]
GWAIPYRSSTALDPSDELSLHAFQTLFILLDYQTPTNKAGDEDADSAEHSADADSNANTPSMILVTGTATGAQNLFRVFIAKLHRTQEFDYLISSIIRLLDEAMRANMSIMASVTKQSTRHAMPQEACILLWILLENNSPLKNYIVDHNNSLKLFSVLLYFMLNGYSDPSQAGMVRTISHILHYLSEDSRFATRLMQPFDQSILPGNMRIADASLTHADFMINTVFTLLSASKPYLVPVYSNLLLLVRNVSPYLTQVSQTTAEKLISLFDIISSPAFIITEPYHIRWLIYLIEVFDYVVHYRAADNPCLMYTMVKARSCFTRLRSFDLDKAKAELAMLREKKGKADSARTIGRAQSHVAIASISSDLPDDVSSRLSSISLSTGTTDVAGPPRSIDGAASPTLSSKARGKRPDNVQASGSNPSEHEQSSALESPAAQMDKGKGKGKSHAAGKGKSANAAPGQKQFQPSVEWVFSWLPDLPLDPIIGVLDALAAHIDRISEEVQRNADAAAAEAPDVAAVQQPESAASRSDVKADALHQPQSLTRQSADGTQTDAASVFAAEAVDSTSAIIHWLSSDAMIQALPDLEDSMPEIRPRLQGLSPAMIVWFRSLLWSLIYGSGMKPFGIWKNTHVRLFVVKHSA